MQYHNMRNAYHNQEKRVFPGEGPYGIPAAPPARTTAAGARVMRFDYALREPDPGDVVVHFFTDDYVSERVWREPERYRRALSRFRAVIAPDFSLYADYPRITQIYNHFRKQWLSAYWSETGIEVVPMVRWVEGDMSSFSWCLDGVPKGSAVCVSTHGGIKGERRKADFLQGWRIMLMRLRPSRILLMGDALQGLDAPCPVERLRLDSMELKREKCGKGGS